MTTKPEQCVIEAAQAFVANVAALREVNRAIRGAKCANATEFEPDTGAPGVEPCVYQKVLVGHGEGENELLPWYAFSPDKYRGGHARYTFTGKSKTAAEIGAEYQYCAECVLQVDRFRERKRLKAKKGGLAQALVRAVGTMQRKATVEA